MEINKTEALEVEKTVNEAEVDVRELGELQLALVGGGCGDVHHQPESTTDTQETQHGNQQDRSAGSRRNRQRSRSGSCVN